MSSVKIRNADGSWYRIGVVAGPQGQTGPQGPRGVTFTPNVTSDGMLIWTNDGGLSNPNQFNLNPPPTTLASLGISVSATEINYLEGVTSGIQEQLNGKAPSHNHPYVPLSGGVSITGAITISDTTPSTSKTTGALKVSGGVGVAGDIYGNNVYGAVYNDYAEYRRCSQHILPGSVVVEVGDDSVICSSDRLQLGAMIISDTYGFCIGESEQGVPVAIAGRVLAYPFEERETFKNSIGRAVCSGPNGTVSIMSDQEVKDNPLAIIGTVSSVPDYNTWGSNNIDVSGRVWIKVK